MTPRRSGNTRSASTRRYFVLLCGVSPLSHRALSKALQSVWLAMKRECVIAEPSPCLWLSPSPSWARLMSPSPCAVRVTLHLHGKITALAGISHSLGGSREELGVLSLGAAVAPGAHCHLLFRCESASGHRKWPDAAGSKWTREGLQPDQQTAISTDGRTRGS